MTHNEVEVALIYEFRLVPNIPEFVLDLYLNVGITGKLRSFNAYLGSLVLLSILYSSCIRIDDRTTGW